MASLCKCHLICPAGTHKPIDLPHGETVAIGRSLLTRIADKKVSRQQLNLKADCQNRQVAVTQLGTNPCQIGDQELAKGSTAVLKEKETLYILAGSYPNVVKFTGTAAEKQPMKRNIGDFFSKKPSDNNKRQAESLDDGKQQKRQKTDSEVVSEDQDGSDDEEHMKKVKERLSRMKNIFGDEPVSKNEGSSHRNEVIPDQVGEPVTNSLWDKHDKLIMYTGAGVRASSKIAAFDIDGCIITTKSGRVFAQDITDWKIQFPEIKTKLKKLISDGYKVVFFTNQLGITRGKLKEPDFRKKIEGIVSTLDLPIQVLIASGPGPFRKPALGMWNYLRDYKNDGIKVDISKSFYVGDAAGRPEKWAPGKKKDFAISDRLFALNAGLTFHTPEEYFLGYRAAPFKMPDFDPRALSKDTPLLSPSSSTLASKEQEIIVFVGLPGSGKSHFARTHLLPTGYVHVNRDTLGSWQKCVEAAQRALKEHRSVVVDNTSVDVESRKRYISVAKSTGVSCRCFWFDVSPQHCRHNERFREITDKSHQAINDMIFNQHKSKFKQPEASEGFAEVVRVNFVPKFKDETEGKLYRQFLLEK